MYVITRKAPPQAKTIHRSGQNATGATLYIVPTGHTLVIISAWCAILSSALAGTGQVTCDSEDGATNQDIVAIKTPAAANLYAPISVVCEIRVPPGKSVIASGTNLTAFTFGFNGYLE